MVEVSLDMLQIAHDVIGGLLILVGALCFAGIVKIEYFNNCRVCRAFKIAKLEDGCGFFRFIQRLFYELKPVSKKQKEHYRFVLYLFLSGLVYIFLGIYIIRDARDLWLAVLFIFVLFFKPFAIFKYIDELIKR
jgi:hypothetical protein